nr:DUF2256 domain-containing protein [Chelativorans sp. ZYF759]
MSGKVRGRAVASKQISKADLPTKICAACGRPFAWRRKWRKDWEAVKYCSDACRKKR